MVNKVCMLIAVCCVQVKHTSTPHIWASINIYHVQHRNVPHKIICKRSNQKIKIKKIDICC